MKQFKVIFLVFATLVTLALGSSVAVAAIVDHPGSNISIAEPLAINDGKDFSVDIYFVGTGNTIGQELHAGTDGAYSYVDADAGSFNLIRIKTNITGWTCWGDCTDTNSTESGIQVVSTANITGGQLFIIIDGLISYIGNGYMSPSGADVGVASGTHVITILYMGKDDSGATQWASDTVVVRIGKTAEEIAVPIEYVSAPLTLDITDLADTTTSITAAAAVPGAYTAYTRQYTYDPTSSLTVTMDGSAVTDTAEAEIGSTTAFSISGTVNSSGFDGSQLQENYTSTVGELFLLDAAGVHALSDNPTTITLFNSGFDPTSTNAVQQVGTFIGVATFGEYGRWIGSFGGYADIEKLSGHADAPFDASFDYTKTFEGVKVFDVPSVKTVTSTETDTNIISSTTKTTESPGFGAIVSLLALGVIAFVAPRFRREI